MAQEKLKIRFLYINKPYLLNYLCRVSARVTSYNFYSFVLKTIKIYIIIDFKILFSPFVAWSFHFFFYVFLFIVCNF